MCLKVYIWGLKGLMKGRKRKITLKLRFQYWRFISNVISTIFGQK